MSKYVLECPVCKTRFKLRSYIDRKRLRCRKCRVSLFLPDRNEEGLPIETDLSSSSSPHPGRTTMRTSKWVLLTTAITVPLFFFLSFRSYHLYHEMRKEEAQSTREVHDLARSRFRAYNKDTYYPLQKNNQWTYKNKGRDVKAKVTQTGRVKRSLDYSVTVEFSEAIKRKRKVYTVTDKGLFLSEEDDLVKYHRYEPEMLILPRDVRKGKTWQWKGTRLLLQNVSEHDKSDLISERCDFNFRAVAIEPVSVHNRTYTCIRIEIDGKRNGNQYSETVWYADHIGIVRTKMRYGLFREDMTLVQYTAMK